MRYCWCFQTDTAFQLINIVILLKKKRKGNFYIMKQWLTGWYQEEFVTNFPPPSPCPCQAAFNKPECRLADDPQNWWKVCGKSWRCLSSIYRVSTKPTVTSFSSFTFNSLITLQERNGVRESSPWLLYTFAQVLSPEGRMMAFQTLLAQIHLFAII